MSPMPHPESTILVPVPALHVRWRYATIAAAVLAGFLAAFTVGVLAANAPSYVIAVPGWTTVATLPLLAFCLTGWLRARRRSLPGVNIVPYEILLSRAVQLGYHSNGEPIVWHVDLNGGGLMRPPRWPFTFDWQNQAGNDADLPTEDRPDGAR